MAHSPSAASREEQVAVVESYFDCFVGRAFDSLPIAPEYTSQTPLTAKLHGQAALDYLKAAAAQVVSIRIKEHIIEGDQVARLLEEETTQGTLEVFAKLELIGPRVKSAHVFYDPRRLSGRTADRP